MPVTRWLFFGVLGAPVNTGLPVASGSTVVGQTLTCSTGTFTNNPSYAFQWLRNGVAVSSETSPTYVLTAADLGTNISCTVTATNAAGQAQATSLPIGPITATGGTLDFSDAANSGLLIPLGVL